MPETKGRSAGALDGPDLSFAAQLDAEGRRGAGSGFRWPRAVRAFDDAAARQACQLTERLGPHAVAERDGIVVVTHGICAAPQQRCQIPQSSRGRPKRGTTGGPPEHLMRPGGREQGRVKCLRQLTIRQHHANVSGGTLAKSLASINVAIQGEQQRRLAGTARS